MTNSTLRSKFDDHKTMNIATVKVAVEMSPSRIAEKLSREIYTDMLRIASFTGVSDLGVESDEILKYLKTLTFIRVGLVSDDRVKALSDYVRIARHLAIPVMFYQCLLPMGVAIDNDFSIEFYPVYSIDSDDLLSPATMLEISDVMLRLEMNGFKICIGVPSERNGELDFMALTHVADEVLSYKRAHSSYGFLASFFKQKEFNEVTGMMCRVLYGYESDYELYVTSIYQALSK